MEPRDHRAQSGSHRVKFAGLGHNSKDHSGYGGPGGRGCTSESGG